MLKQSNDMNPSFKVFMATRHTINQQQWLNFVMWRDTGNYSRIFVDSFLTNNLY